MVPSERWLEKCVSREPGSVGWGCGATVASRSWRGDDVAFSARTSRLENVASRQW
ncbi:hypothetical protein HanIR_Chr12g0595981 [Helianthus annuus]|nr:hypothetical protein HanIR_Chr12g0595981 [Helianthus annuus]